MKMEGALVASQVRQLICSCFCMPDAGSQPTPMTLSFVTGNEPALAATASRTRSVASTTFSALHSSTSSSGKSPFAGAGMKYVTSSEDDRENG